MEKEINKLATFNDIWDVNIDGTPGCDDCDICEKFLKTRKEVIKWYKHFQAERKKDIDKKYLDRSLGAMRFIKPFFDISKEDLK